MQSGSPNRAGKGTSPHRSNRPEGATTESLTGGESTRRRSQLSSWLLLALICGAASHRATAETLPRSDRTHARNLPPLSPIGQAVSAALDDYAARYGSSFSRLTVRNAAPPELLLATPLEPSVEPRNGLPYYRAVARLLETSRHDFRLATLNFTSHSRRGGITAPSPLVEVLAPALRRLHENRLHDPVGTAPVEVRILFSRALLPYATWFPTLGLHAVRQQLLSHMTRNGRPIPESEWRFKLEVRVEGWTPSPRGWSHAKLVLQDGETVVVGSQNFTNDSLQTPEGTQDINVALKGEVAAVASQYFEQHWARAERWLAHLTSSHSESRQGQESQAVLASPVPESFGESGLPVFVLARYRPYPEPPTHPFDRSADEALIAAFDASARRIDLSQQMLLAPYRSGVFAGEVFDALARAVLRSVKVRLVLSAPWGPPRFFDYRLMDAAHTRARLEAHIRAYGVERLKHSPAEVSRLIRSNLHVGDLGLNSLVPRRSHHKFIAFDETAFYVGSQNLYPGGIGTLKPFPSLGELGLLVDDASLASVVMTRFWRPLWSAVQMQTGDSDIGTSP